MDNLENPLRNVVMLVETNLEYEDLEKEINVRNN